MDRLIEKGKKLKKVKCKRCGHKSSTIRYNHQVNMNSSNEYELDLVTGICIYKRWWNKCGMSEYDCIKCRNKFPDAEYKLIGWRVFKLQGNNSLKRKSVWKGKTTLRPLLKN